MKDFGTCCPQAERRPPPIDQLTGDDNDPAPCKPTALEHTFHRPDLRKAMSRAEDAMLESADPEVQACGAWIHGLTDRKEPPDR